MRTGTFEAAEDTGAVLSESDLVAQMYNESKVDQDEIADHDWMEFTWLLRAHCPDILIEVMVILRARVKAFEEEAEEEEDGHHQGGHTPFRETHGEGEGSQKRAVDPDEESAI